MLEAVRGLSRRRSATFAAALTTAVVVTSAPASASASPFDRTFTVRCTLSNEDSPQDTQLLGASLVLSGTTGVTSMGARIVPTATPSLKPDSAARSVLSGLGDSVRLSLRSIPLALDGALGPSVEAAWTPSYAGPILPGTESYDFDRTQASSYGAPIAIEDQVTVRFTSLTAEVTAQTGERYDRYTLQCLPAPGAPLELATVAVAPNDPPELPAVVSLSDRGGSSAGGRSVVIGGRFEGAVQSVTFGGTPAAFERLSFTQIRATAPPHAVADDVQVRVVTAAGESADSAADDFDYTPANERVLERTVVNDCRGSYGPMVVEARVRVPVPAFVNPGDPLTVKARTTALFGAETVERVRLGGFVTYADLAPTTQELAFAGTTVSAASLAAPAPTVRQALGSAAPFAVAVPGSGYSPEVSAGTVTAPRGSSVEVRAATFQLRWEGSGTDRFGMPTGLSTELTCVPRDAALGSIPVGETTTVDYGYDLAGSATLKTLTKGSVPLSGGIDAALSLPSGEFTADLALAPTTANLTTLGFLPITASVAFVSTAPTTGTLKDGLLTSNSKVRIKLPRVSLFGLQLAGGANCQTKTVSNIALSSSGAAFDPLAGGTLTGTFAISDLTGCGFLTGLVSPLTAGKGNAIALKLTPRT